MGALAILLICLVGIGVGNSTRDATFRICKNRQLESDLISHTKVRSLLECAAKSTTNYNSSNSANFMKSSQTCELYNDILTQTQCDQLVSNDSTTVIIKTNNPCKNNQPFDGISCICSPPLYGEFCEQGGPKDCGDFNQTGYFDVYPNDGMGNIRVYCWEHRTMLFAAPKGGFTLEYNNKTWQEYKYGFGNIKGTNNVIGAYWLGNENIHRITNGAISYACAFWFEPMTSRTYNCHFHFKVDSETENYTINYDTSDGESHRKLEKNALFSTIDRNKRKCAATNAVGFWFDNVCSKTPPLFGSYILSGNTHLYDGFWTYLWRM